MIPTSSSLFSLPITTVILGVLAMVLIALFLLAVVVIQLETRLRHLATPVYDKAVRDAEEKAEHILAEAREQAEALRVKAQDEAQKIFQDRQNEDERFREEQEKHIAEITAHAKDLLNKQTSIIPKLTEQMEQVFADIGTKVQKEYQVIGEETKKRMQDELTKEIEASREAVRAYKQERLKRIDQDIIGLIEDTARIALGKSLSLREHRDIVLAALTEAKQQGVFGQLP